VVTILAVLVIMPARAQLFTDESVGGAALGGLIGGIIGHNSGRRTAEGIGIGAGAGFLLGALAHQSRRDYSYGGGYYHYGAPAYYAPGYYSYYSAPAYIYRPLPRRVVHVAPVQVYVQNSSPAPTAQVQSNPQPTVQPQPVHSAVPQTSMSGANALFGR
jgi:hypothetical protein